MNEKRDVPRQRPNDRLRDDDDRLEESVAPGIDEVVRALVAPGTPEELQDESRYLSMFREVGLQDGPEIQMEAAPERKSLRTVVISGRVAAVVAASLVTGVGMAAAYTGALPRGLQSSAHRHLGVQAPPAGSSSASNPAGRRLASVPAESRSGGLATATSIPPLAPSKAGTRTEKDGFKGRCNAWSKGGLATTSSAYHQLVVEAGGVDGIAAYCSSALAQPSRATHTKQAKAPKQQPTDAATGSSKPHATVKSGPPGQLKK